jgi:outer membrane lipopolysaccharide assembly protein LptE/RlpB
MMIRNLNLLLYTLHFTLYTLLAGCGYTTRSLLPARIKTIYIEPFVNKIDISSEDANRLTYRVYRPMLESDITKAIIERFMLDGNLTIARREDADLILKGELTDYIRDPLKYDADYDPQEYRVSLVVNLTLEDIQKGQLILDNSRLIGDATYFTRGSLASTEAQALDNAIKDLARRVVEKTVEEWW